VTENGIGCSENVTVGQIIFSVICRAHNIEKTKTYETLKFARKTTKDMTRKRKYGIGPTQSSIEEEHDFMVRVKIFTFSANLREFPRTAIPGFKRVWKVQVKFFAEKLAECI
jgi:hypothetical protein